MTWEDVNKNLAARSTTQLRSLLTKSGEDTLILLSGNDTGVIRNGGRNGSCFGPQAISSQLLKMAKRDINSKIRTYSTCSNNLPEDFDQFQENQVALITTQLKDQNTVLHLGGGHDHIYTLTSSLAATNSQIVIINIDAHLDTRMDALKHSGTPFRQLKQELGDRVKLTQIGIHDYANSDENYNNLEMEIVHMNKLKADTKNFSDNNDFIEKLFRPYAKDSCVIISLDADAIRASEMQAVSAVNHDGIPMKFIHDLLANYKNKFSKKYYGIYEYNPLYDDLACSSARHLCASIYTLIKNCSL
jgi:formiminoglutamase